MRLVIPAFTFPVLAVMAVAAPLAAQTIGGVPLYQQGGYQQGGYATGYALQVPRSGAAQLQSALTATDRRSTNQAMIGRLRGDAGYLGGFAFGTPLSPSVQSQPSSEGWGGNGGRARIVVNNFEGPVAIGDGNVIQQQYSDGSGSTAQQQVANLPGGAPVAGASNVIIGNGKIAQHANSSR